MKKILFVIFACFFAIFACNKKQNAKPTPATSSFHQGFIPHWNVDTFYTYFQLDTIYSFLNNDTTKLKYKNNIFYIWWSDGGMYQAKGTFNDSIEGWFGCWIGRKCFDTLSATCLCQVGNRIYWDSFYKVPQWDTQHATITIITNQDSLLGGTGDNKYTGNYY